MYAIRAKRFNLKQNSETWMWLAQSKDNGDRIFTDDGAQRTVFVNQPDAIRWRDALLELYKDVEIITI